MAAITIQSEIIAYKYGVKRLEDSISHLHIHACSCILEYIHMMWSQQHRVPVCWNRKINETFTISMCLFFQCYVTHTVSSLLLPEVEIHLRVIAREHVTCPRTTHHLISVHLIHPTGILSASPARASRHRHTPPPGERLWFKNSNPYALRHYPPDHRPSLRFIIKSGNWFSKFACDKDGILWFFNIVSWAAWRTANMPTIKFHYPEKFTASGRCPITGAGGGGRETDGNIKAFKIMDS